MLADVANAAVALSGKSVFSWWTNLHHYVPIGVVGLLSWSVWIIRFSLSRVYRPAEPGFHATTSVVVPSFREDPDILRRCLDSWLAENPTEVIVVPDLADTSVISMLQSRAVIDPRLVVIPFAHTGKRSALGVGIRASTSQILVLSDSDTMWEQGLIEQVLAPFADPKIGGVGTRQNAYRPGSSIWRRVADWMIDVRYLDYVRAQARIRCGGVPVRTYGRLPSQRRDPGARASGGRVLPGPQMRFWR